ncbi:MFS transporter [Desulfospira joergensenii]|uniref:MFS transporter n=1 Tax=Desulfospira joergensenii TaxID=53329 RepID=UPI0003B75AF4|nr:MFS transporter [Desulfospira joergensenii]
MDQTPRQFHAFIGVATFTKLLLNITRRLVYPFAPEFARGTGVGLAAITPIIALNQITGVLGPVGAAFADRYGYKRVMLAALVLAAIGAFGVGFFPFYTTLALCLFFGGLAKCIFDPTLQAYIGKSVPYEQRGRYIGIMEIAWAGSTLMGIPLAGLVIARFSWHAPFLILGVLTVFCFVGILKFMARDKIPESQKHPSRALFLSNWKIIMKNPKVLGMLGFAFFMSLGSDNLFIVYGAWLEQSYGLSLAAIGFGTILIGLAELLGEGCTALISDRLGLRRAILLGGVLCSGAYFLLPVLDRGLVFVLAGLFLVFFFFEFTLVTSMGLATELVPEFRASTLSAFYAVAGLGRVSGAFCGGLVWSRSDILSISLISGVCTLLALACLTAGARSGNSS